MQQVKLYGATFSGKKAFIGVPRAAILGHVCTYEGRVADPSRVQAIQDWPVPKSVSEVRAFLGTCGVLWIFIKNYTLVARPLIHLTRKDVPLEISSQQLESMRPLKAAILKSPADLLSFLEMLAACLYLPCLPKTCLHLPRLVPASLQLSLPCHIFRMVFTGVSVVSRVPLSSPESLCCHQSSFSFRVPCPQSSVFLELSLYSPMTSSFHHSVTALCLCS